MKKILFFLILSGLAWAAYGQTPYDTVNVYDPQNFVEMTTIDTANGQIMSRKNNLNRRVGFHTLKKYATPDVFATWVNTVFDSVGNSSTYYDYFVTDSTGKTWYIDDIGRGKLLDDRQRGVIDSVYIATDTLWIDENGVLWSIPVDSLGGGGGGAALASNGLTMDGDTVQLGGTLNELTTINMDGKTLLFSEATLGGRILADMTNASGVTAQLDVNPSDQVYATIYNATHGAYYLLSTSNSLNQYYSPNGTCAIDMLDTLVRIYVNKSAGSDNYMRLYPEGVYVGPTSSGSPSAQLDIEGDLRIRTVTQNDTLTKIAALDYTTGKLHWVHADSLGGSGGAAQTLSTSNDSLTISGGNTVRVPGTGYVRDSVTTTTLTVDLANHNNAIVVLKMESATNLTLTINNPWSAVSGSYPNQSGETGTYSFHFRGIAGTDNVTWPAAFVDMTGAALGTDALVDDTLYTCFYDPVELKYYCK